MNFLWIHFSTNVKNMTIHLNICESKNYRKSRHIFIKPWYSYHSENVITYIISWCLSSSQFFGCEVFKEVFKKDVKWGTNTKDTVSVNMTRSDCHLFSFHDLCNIETAVNICNHSTLITCIWVSKVSNSRLSYSLYCL